MTPQRWRQIDEIFQSAAELAPGRRSGFLNEACAGDESLRAEIEKLIAALEKAGDFMEGAPPLDILPAGNAAFGPGCRIGVYELMREIGRGGMGTVYLAARADQEFSHRVAIKLVQSGLDHTSIIRRFRNERQILAGLDHPHIARLLDGGTTESGLPYFVMEYVEGQPIGSYCETNALPLTRRLELFLAVCSAVHYAHQNLIVHRDIKPGNILVTADGVPKLLDFGIAKLLSPSAPAGEVTELTGQVMTPEYASPEQVSSLPITTASDVYSLGVLLYELLTAQKPYRLKSRTPLEIAQAICQQEAEKPSSRSSSRELKGDLDNIVLKAMQKEPRHRYGSVDQFADDIRRYLEGLPVRARTATVSYRAGKFVRRHKAGVAAAVLVSMALAAGAASTMWEARRAVEQRARAERRFNDVRRLANSFLFEFHDAIKQLPGSTAARALIVKRGLEYLESLAAESRGDRSLMSEIAAAYEKVAEVQGNPMVPNLGDTRGALATYRKALAIREALAAAEPGNAGRQRELAALYGSVSEILVFDGDNAGAVANARRAVETYQAVSGSFASDRTFQSDLAMSLNRFANLLQDEGDIGGSLTWYQRAVEQCRRMVNASPSDPDGKMHLATALDGMGGVLQQKGETAAALENRQTALRLRHELVAAYPNNTEHRRQLGFAHHNVGLSLAEAGDLKAALLHFRAEMDLFKALREADPNDVQARRNVSLAYKQIGDTLVRLADWNGARDQYSAALDIDRTLSSADTGNYQALLDLSFSEGKLGFVLGKLGRTQEALAMLQKGVASQEFLVNNEPNDDGNRGFLANSYTRLAEYLMDAGKHSDALGYFAKALALRQTVYARNPADTSNRGALAECYLNLGKALAASDRKRALEYDHSAVDLLESLAAADTSNANVRIRLADATMNAARLHSRMGPEEWVRARSLYLRSRDLWSALQRAGKLPPADRQQPQEVIRELAACDESIAKLALSAPN